MDQKTAEDYSRLINKLEGECSYWMDMSGKYRLMNKSSVRKMKRYKVLSMIEAAVILVLIVTVCIK